MRSMPLLQSVSAIFVWGKPPLAPETRYVIERVQVGLA